MGYFRIALRVLDTLEMITNKGDWFEFTESSKALRFFESREIQDLIRSGVAFSWIEFLKKVTTDSISTASKLVNAVKSQWDPAPSILLPLMNGLVVAPLLVALHKVVADWNYEKELVEVDLFGCDPSAAELILPFLEWIGLGRLIILDGQKAATVLHLSLQGRYFLGRCLNMGVAVSYQPLLCGVEELLYGSPAKVLEPSFDTGIEQHVHRSLNVIGSGSMHRGYFISLCECVGELFNSSSFDSQPQYIIDMGCGDGHLLKLVYEYISQKNCTGLKSCQLSDYNDWRRYK
jgi:hypothetical protein